jgi:hypothetical protein
VHTKLQPVNLEDRDHLGDLHIDEKIILKRISKKGMSGSGLDSCGSGEGKVDCYMVWIFGFRERHGIS